MQLIAEDWLSPVGSPRVCEGQPKDMSFVMFASASKRESNFWRK